ncbi:MAG: hypothetical protein P4M14_06465 [Gammaproteobacteria bacterium]|nr:hypothetical protein [Gammaproteobacteria bacterium]
MIRQYNAINLLLNNDTPDAGANMQRNSDLDKDRTANQSSTAIEPHDSDNESQSTVAVPSSITSPSSAIQFNAKGYPTTSILSLPAKEPEVCDPEPEMNADKDSEDQVSPLGFFSAKKSQFETPASQVIRSTNTNRRS